MPPSSFFSTLLIHLDNIFSQVFKIFGTRRKKIVGNGFFGVVLKLSF